MMSHKLVILIGGCVATKTEQTNIKCPKCDDCLCKEEIKSDYQLLTKNNYKLCCQCCGFEKLVLQI